MFVVGDVVVCVATQYSCSSCGADGNEPAVLPDPVLRRFYRVAEAGEGHCADCNHPLLVFLPTEFYDPVWAWPQSCFSKIEPASEDIFKLAKIKEPV